MMLSFDYMCQKHLQSLVSCDNDQHVSFGIFCASFDNHENMTQQCRKTVPLIITRLGDTNCFLRHCVFYRPLSYHYYSFIRNNVPRFVHMFHYSFGFV